MSACMCVCMHACDFLVYKLTSFNFVNDIHSAMLLTACVIHEYIHAYMYMYM